MSWVQYDAPQFRWVSTVEAMAASMPVSISPFTPGGSSSAMPRTYDASRSACSSSGASPGSGGNSTSRPRPSGSQSRLRSTTCVPVNTTAAVRASRSLRQAIVRWAR